MSDLERYLRRATRGLWGRRRVEVRVELRGSVEARVWALEAQGWGRDEALSRALRELGKPEAISAGLVKVHTMPKLAQSVVAVALFASLAVTTLSPSAAQVEAVTRWNQVQEVARFPYFGLASLKASLESLGVAVDATPRPPRMAGSSGSNPNLSLAPNPALTFTLPGASRPVTVQAWPAIALSADGRFGALKPREVAEVFDGRPADVYVSGADLLERLAESGLPVTLEGWRNPRVSVGGLSLTLGTPGRPVYAYPLYALQAYSSLRRNPDLRPAGGPMFARAVIGGALDGLLHPHAVRVGAPAGTVYAVATVVPSRGLAVQMDVARVSERGVLEFLLPWRRVEFTDNPGALQDDHEALEAKGFAVDILYNGYSASERAAFSGRPARAVLLRLTGRVGRNAPGAEVVVPARVRSAALR